MTEDTRSPTIGEELQALKDQNERYRKALEVARPFIPDGKGRFCVCGTCVACGQPTPYTDYTHCALCARALVDAALSAKEADALVPI